MRVPRLSAHAVRSLFRALRKRDALAGGVLPPALRERIILHVSSINRCAVCASIHGRAAASAGLDQREVSAALSRDTSALDPRTGAALRYAELRTLDAESGSPDVVAAFEQQFTPREQEEVRAVVDLFTFNNRFNNTWEGILPGAARRRRKLGLRE
jgi:AhpD family alkylhydroperoxidase